MKKLSINLFGVFEMRIDGVPIRMPTRRVGLILALLALNPDKALSRSYLAALIWPEQQDAQARSSLRQAIFRLRSALGADHSGAIETTSGWLRLRREAIELDIDALAGDVTPQTEAPSGLPLDGLSGFEPEIEELLETARADIRRQLVAWLASATKTASEARQYPDLERLARQHLAIEPYDESALRSLMEALWRQGRRNAALDAFREGSHRIRSDLSVPVEPDTLALFQSIRSAQKRQEAPFVGPGRPAVQLTARNTRCEPAASEPVSHVDAQDIPLHLRHIAVIHVVSERLLAALQDPDPESAEAGSRSAISAIEEIVSREGGKIVERAGHRISCTFGAERPDESPALSAAYAAFEIASQDCAIGVHAGSGLVGSDSTVFPLTHMAQSIAAEASVGEVRISSTVEIACRGAFDLQSVATGDPLSASGKTKAWRLSGETPSRSGFDIRKARGLSRFCGREAERQTLASLSRIRGPRVAVIIGEAGIGKSRLVHEFLKAHRPAVYMRVQFSQGEACGGPDRFADALRTLIGSSPSAPAPEVVAALRSRLSGISVPDDLISPLEAVLDANAEVKEWRGLPRGRRFQALADSVLTMCGAIAGSDCILLVEDAHWTDEDGRLLLDRLVRSLDGAGPMIIITQRPGTNETWIGHGEVRNIALRSLDDHSATELLTNLGLQDAAQKIVLERGAGVPLFLEELARAVDAENMAGSWRETEPRMHSGLPVALQGLLTHRINNLPGAMRQLLEAAAVLGAEPTDQILKALSGLRHEAYETAISGLADADLLFRIRTFPERSFGFKHALVQDAAYQGIPNRRRAELHASIVAVHDELDLSEASDRAAPLAHHAFEGALFDRAIEFAMRAARLAADRSAYATANRMTEIALHSIAKSEPRSDNLLRLEADILSWRRALLWPLGQKKRTVEGLERAEAISRDLGDDHKLAEVCIHRAYIHSDDGNADIGLGYCDRADAAARRVGAERLVAETALARCQIFSLHGRMRESLSAIRGYETAWDERRHALDGLLVTRYVMLQFHLARAHAALGDGEAAWRHARQAAVAATETRRPVDRYVACRVIGEIAEMTGARELAMKAFSDAREIGLRAELPAYMAWAEAEIAELKLASSEAEAGASQLRVFLENSDKSLIRIAQIKAQAALACFASQKGDENAMSFLSDALAEAEQANMPMVRIRILREMSGLCRKRSLERAISLGKEADALAASEGYLRGSHPPRAPAEALIGNLLEMP